MSVVRKLYFSLGFIYFLCDFSSCLLQTCDENDTECIGSLQVPVLSKYSAPLKVDLDLTEMTDQITKIIHYKVKENVAKILPELIENALEAMENNIQKVFNVTDMLRDKLENITSRVDNVEMKLEFTLNASETGITNMERRLEKAIDITDRLLDVVEDAKLIKNTGSDGEAHMEYVTIFTEPYDSRLVKPALYVHSQSDVTITLMEEENTRNLTLRKGSTKITLSNSIFMNDIDVKNKVARIISNEPISVYGFQRHVDTCDGYLALPVSHLSRHYVVPSFSVWHNRQISKSQIGIASLGKETTIKIKVKTTFGGVRYKGKEYASGKTISTVLPPFHSIQLSNTYDLSGSIVSASNPVAVVSGNKCNSISHAACNHFTEFILPAEQLDTEFIIPVISTISKSTVRLLTYEDNAVDINGKERKQITLNQSEYHDIEHLDLTYIRSTKGLMITIYPHEQKGDSFMMTINGVNQYKARYNFVVPNGFSSYVSVALVGGIRSGRRNAGFILDGENVTFTRPKKKSVKGIEYLTFSLNVTSGAHSLSHQGSRKFGLWLYGFREADGYGFPAGIALR